MTSNSLLTHRLHPQSCPWSCTPCALNSTVAFIGIVRAMFAELTIQLWVQTDNAKPEACKEDVGGVLGVKESMIAHILGKNSCSNVSTQAQKMAKAPKKGKGNRSKDKALENEADDEWEGKKQKKLLTKVEAVRFC
ncbi:hypothetical protein C0993_000856 [Termitomyces sp. T159_Od127]|nr:hypothetical protein C0993_000856 [Termitomyces sp. T159_Od127]